MFLLATQNGNSRHLGRAKEFVLKLLASIITF